MNEKEAKIYQIYIKYIKRLYPRMSLKSENLLGS